MHEMALQTTSPLRIGQVFEISFPTFTPRITIHSERKLSVEIVLHEEDRSICVDHTRRLRRRP
jgi:hypothetical protein